VLRPLGFQVTEEDIEREAAAISVLAQAGKNRNIVTIRGHGWLPNRDDIYYIDMEYCSKTLHDRIEQGSRNENALSRPEAGGERQFAIGGFSHPAEVMDQEKNCQYVPPSTLALHITDQLVGAGNHVDNQTADLDWASVLKIIEDIVSGLKYLHDHHTVHRDLKPRNSTLNTSYIITVVLFSEIDRCWKIADFGTACQATSKRLNTTREARGTQGYRAPEVLILDDARYNKKSDIFALGCIIYEIVTGRKLFQSDVMIWNYQSTGQLPVCWWPYIVADEKPSRLLYLENLLASTLERDAVNRPNAQRVLEKLRSISEDPFGKDSITLTDDRPIQVFLH